MKNRYYYPIILLLSLFTLQGYSQTKVMKVNAIKANNYGVEYVLPKTQLVVEVEYSEITEKAGQYARYASRYLGLDDSKVVFDDQTTFVLDKVSVYEKGIPNKEQTYLIEFKAKTTAPFVYLTPDGVICTINAEYIPEPETENQVIKEVVRESFINPQSIFTQDYLQAGSVSKMAEEAAKSIYSIRESRQDIIRGDVESMPKDGEAMRIVLSSLEEQEQLWMELFAGSKQTKKHSKRIIIDPTAELEKEVLFRFSKYEGVVDKDDLSGSPVYINLRDMQTVEFPLEEDPKRKAKEPQSIVYNVPGKAEVELFYGNRPIYRGEHNITYFGKTQILGTHIFEDKNNPIKIYFNPQTGGIRQIIQ